MALSNILSVVVLIHVFCVCIFPKKGFYLIHLTQSEPITIASERLPVCWSTVASSLIPVLRFYLRYRSSSCQPGCECVSCVCLSVCVCVLALIKLWVVAEINVFPDVRGV